MIGRTGNRRISLARRRQQRHEQDDERRGKDEEPVRLSQPHGFEEGSVPLDPCAVSYESRSSCATCLTCTVPLRPLLSWIMQAGQLVATTSAPLSSIARRFRSKIFAAVS